MKHCNACQATYSDRVDFCFNDGMVLVGQALATGAYGSSGLDLPLQRGLRSADTDAPAVPRARRRSLLGGQREGPAASSVQIDAPLAPVGTPDPTGTYTPPEPGPPPPPLPWVEPPPQTLSPAEATATELEDDGLEPGEEATLESKVAITETPPPVRNRGTPPPAPANAGPAPVDPEELPSFDDDEPPVPPARPAWFLPALLGGGLALVLVVGVGVAAIGGVAVLGMGSPAAAPAAAPAVTAPVPAPAPPEAVPVPAEVPPPAPAVVSVDLVSVPPGASLTVDGQPVGQTPSTLDLAVGEHTVDVALTGFGPMSRAITVGPESAPIAPFVLIAMPAATPAGATPTPPAVTPPPAAPPATVPTAPAKPPTTPAKPLAPAVEPPAAWSTEPAPAATKPPPAAAAPTPPTALPPGVREGRVLVTGTGTLTVDGVLVGPLPASVKLTEGKHVFSVSTDGAAGASVTKDIVFAENGRAVLQL